MPPHYDPQLYWIPSSTVGMPYDSECSIKNYANCNVITYCLYVLMLLFT